MFLVLFVMFQEHVVKKDLLNALHCEFINRVNEVGVDVNRAIAHPYTQNLVQFVCGLGSRKGSQLLKVCDHCSFMLWQNECLWEMPVIFC